MGDTGLSGDNREGLEGDENSTRHCNRSLPLCAFLFGVRLHCEVEVHKIL